MAAEASVDTLVVEASCKACSTKEEKYVLVRLLIKDGKYVFVFPCGKCGEETEANLEDLFVLFDEEEQKVVAHSCGAVVDLKLWKQENKSPV